MRGRVMSLWFVAFQGSTPIGGPLVGALMALAGPRAGLALGAITCLVVAALGLSSLRRSEPPASEQLAVDGRGLARGALPRELSGAREPVAR
jgi:MFS family permease